MPSDWVNFPIDVLIIHPREEPHGITKKNPDENTNLVDRCP